MLPCTSALAVIDVQFAFDNPVWGERNNPHAEQMVCALIEAFRTHGLPVIHVHHQNPIVNGLFQPNTRAVEPKPQAQPMRGEATFVKRVNSAFIGTDLETYLRDHHIDTLVIVGLTTDHCCSTTARMASNLGFMTYFVSDATATFARISPLGHRYTAEQMHDSALTSLSGEFATIITAKELIELLTREAEDTSLVRMSTSANPNKIVPAPL